MGVPCLAAGRGFRGYGFRLRPNALRLFAPARTTTAPHAEFEISCKFLKILTKFIVNSENSKRLELTHNLIFFTILKLTLN